MSECARARISFPFELRTATESRERGERARHRGGKTRQLSFFRTIYTKCGSADTFALSLSLVGKREKERRGMFEATAAPKSLSFSLQRRGTLRAINTYQGRQSCRQRRSKTWCPTKERAANLFLWSELEGGDSSREEKERNLEDEKVL